jgi:RNA polymerase sigma factor (sigma-70 family)
MARHEDLRTNAASVKKDRELTSDLFQAFLNWLDPDPEIAGKRYQEIHAKLIKIFQYRGCHRSEELADETINRVIKRVSEISEEYEGDPALYFFGVANYIYQEYLKSQKIAPVKMPPNQTSASLPSEEDYETEKRHECLERCLSELDSDERELILQYYKEEKQRKIENRKDLSERWQLSALSLRKRTQRIREKLKVCVNKCLNQKD